MLVLTRKRDEKVVIGDEGNEIIITILKIQGGEKVSIGIQANANTPIFRSELLNRQKQLSTKQKKVLAMSGDDDQHAESSSQEQSHHKEEAEENEEMANCKEATSCC